MTYMVVNVYVCVSTIEISSIFPREAKNSFSNEKLAFSQAPKFSSSALSDVITLKSKHPPHTTRCKDTKPFKAFNFERRFRNEFQAGLSYRSLGHICIPLACNVFKINTWAYRWHIFVLLFLYSFARSSSVGED